MDLKTEQVLKLIKTHLRIKNYLITICYGLIIFGLFVYIFSALNQSRTIKIINQYKENPDDFKIEKIMTNPRLDFQYNATQVYHIQAKKAVHADNQAAIMYDVFATGDIGNITAGELKIEEEGDHLIFTKNPVLILNKTTK